MEDEDSLPNPFAMEEAEPTKPEKLSSNVMNYLVWRYLQETGHDRAAIQLQRNWMGTGPDSSPEKLPFAAHVRKNTLINLAQDGLLLDDIRAQAQKNSRNYYFGPDHGPKFSVPASELRERRNGKDASRNPSRISSAGERVLQNGTPADNGVQRANKRPRRSAGADRRMNGDMMDVDGGTVGPMSMDDPTVAEAESPVPMVEDEPVPLESTLDIGIMSSTQTESPADLLPGTSVIAFESQPVLGHIQWSAHSAKALFVAGKNFMRTYKIDASPPENGIEAISQSTALQAPNFDIELFCWTEKGQGVFAIRETYENEDGARMELSKLMFFSEYGKRTGLLDPAAGIAMKLRYNPDSKLLAYLYLGSMASIKIWKLTPDGFVHLGNRCLNAEILDMAWTSPESVLVCGICTLEIYTIDEHNERDVKEETEEGHRSEEVEIYLEKTIETPHDWGEIKVDKVCNIVAVLEEQGMALGVMKLDNVSNKIEVKASERAFFSSSAFQPIKYPSSRSENLPRLLATATHTGKIQFWNVLEPLASGPLFEMSMGKGSFCKEIEFSPDGGYLATAGYNKVMVWKAEKGAEPKAVWDFPIDNDKFKVRPTIADENEDWAHSLTWDADGKKIAYGLDSQVAIIRMRNAIT